MIEHIKINTMSALLSFTQFTDFASYFSFPFPFSVYLGLAVVVFGVLLCAFVGMIICLRRCCCTGDMKMNPDEFSSTRQIVDIEMANKGQQSIKHKRSRYKAKLGDSSIQEEPSSHGYEDIEDLDEDDYENVGDKLSTSGSDSDDFDYENLRGGV
ncbi:uncharacterized protein LOC134273054 [Saccostrea cucullata]|uniref:uncharacterized protein LOC134273054 n=1 Tax=Saccostrea cuccullata TaxID=36930 RepID=UPI002ED5045B